MNDQQQLEHLAECLQRRNQIAAEVTQITGRPCQIGHVGEFIAAKVFDIALEVSAVAKSIDGRFRDGPLTGRSVNVKWYAKREGLLDITPEAPPDYYLVLAGPRSPAASSRGEVRPWWIESVYLFEASDLLSALQARGVRIGIATSVRRDQWDAAEVYPQPRQMLLPVSDEQQRLLRLFAEPETT